MKSPKGRSHAQISSLVFPGKLLQRGYWIYVFRVKSSEGIHLYVGRTGDSSSKNASSPFARLGRHLDVGVNAKANTLIQRLRGLGIDPENCDYELIAVGPLFPEQPSMKEHLPFRNQMAALERAVADDLKHRGYQVLGSHPRVGHPDLDMLKRCITIIKRRLKALER